MRKINYSILMAMLCLFFILTGIAPAQDTDSAPTEAEVTEVAPEELEISKVATNQSVGEETSKPALSVLEAKICEGMIDQEPVAAGDIFSKDIPVLYCFSRIKSNHDTEIKHTWYFQGTLVAEIPLNIGTSSAWRTYSSKNILPKDEGNWRVEIVTASGESLETIQFVVN